MIWCWWHNVSRFEMWLVSSRSSPEWLNPHWSSKTCLISSRSVFCFDGYTRMTRMNCTSHWLHRGSMVRKQSLDLHRIVNSGVRLIRGFWGYSGDYSRQVEWLYICTDMYERCNCAGCL